MTTIPSGRRVSIAHLPRRIAALTDHSAPSPRKVYDLVLRSVFPAEHINGRWFVDADRISEIAEIWTAEVAPLVTA